MMWHTTDPGVRINDIINREMSLAHFNVYWDTNWLQYGQQLLREFLGKEERREDDQLHGFAHQEGPGPLG